VAQPLSRVLPSAPAPVRPILLLGCPRSGTSILLQLLLQSLELRSVHSEGHILWQPHHHPRDHDWESDALGAGDLSERERDYIYMAVRIVVGDRRFIDKTPESCLRVPYLRALFPDATFVFLRRRAAANVSSLMEGWRARPRFVTYRLPQPLEGLGPLSGDRWSFVLVPGWRDLRFAPLEEICARQYVVCNEAVLDARGDARPDSWIDVDYDDLVAAPVATGRSLFESLGLPFAPEAERFAAALDRTPGPTALSARPGEALERNRAAVERIRPLIEATERRLGW
jgi:hypothetical protein